MEYPRETFTEAERARLAPHFSNLDEPVFAVVNLPETVKGALFARYSRYPGTLRRLFLDEFADSLPAHSGAWESGEGGRAAELYERIFLGYGDDSVAQLGGAHIACEWCSNLLTKALQRPRLGAYLEQSTRYIAYDAPMDSTGAYRYYRAPELGPEYEAAMDAIFRIYSESLPVVTAWVADQFPRGQNESEAAHTRAAKAKAFDLLRGLLPAGTLSHMGIFATGQTYEQLILHLLAHPLPEANHYGALLLRAVQAVIPSFVARVERPDRGGKWTEYLQLRNVKSDNEAELLDVHAAGGSEGPSVKLLRAEGDELDVAAALLFESSGVSETEIRAALAEEPERAQSIIEHLGSDRENRRHRPGRGLEAVRYRFEIVSDYGAFRDLQRHRMLTVQWQELTPELGAEVPAEVDAAGAGDAYRRALEISRTEYWRLVHARQWEPAQYAVCLGYRIRYVLDLNARAAMQLIELRSGREGHPSYRAVAHAMHARIAEVHPTIAATMTHVDRTTEPRLERLMSEMRTEAKRDAANAR